MKTPITVITHHFFDTLGITPPAIEIRVRSDIPIASGLGSGAAISCAIIRTLNKHLGDPLDVSAINELVYEIEKIHHGTPSGIDNTVIVYEKPLRFVREEPMTFLDIQTPVQLIIANTGVKAPTHIAVGDVRRLYETNTEEITQVLNEIGNIADEAQAILESASGDLIRLGKLMSRNHALLGSLTVSSPELNNLCDVALNNGALGAKLSGGGRGGNMLALVTQDQIKPVSSALSQAGATQVIHTVVG